jgi:hypothetical protein
MEIKNWFSFVRPLYPHIHWDFHWSIGEIYWNLLLPNRIIERTSE